MLRKPSASRRGGGPQEIELPLVPMMDAFVTLIAFLLLAATLISVTLIDTPIPIASALKDDNQKKPLTLTLRVDQDGFKLESGFKLITPVTIPKTTDKYDLDKLHEALVAIKLKFPTDKQLILMPAAQVVYDDLVQIMDAARKLAKTDPPLYLEGEGGVQKVETDLFSEVLFGNVTSGN